MMAAATTNPTPDTAEDSFQHVSDETQLATHAEASHTMPLKENKHPIPKKTKHVNKYQTEAEFEVNQKLRQFELYIEGQAANDSSFTPHHKNSGKKPSENASKVKTFQDKVEGLQFQKNLIDLKSKVYEDLRLIQVGLSQDYSYMEEIFQEFWNTRKTALNEAIAKADELAEIIDKAESVDASKRNVLIDHLKASLDASRWIKKCVTVEAVADIKESLSNYLRLDYGEVSRLGTYVDNFLGNPKKFSHAPSLRPTCDPFLVMVTHVVDPGEFYVVRWCEKDKLERISRTLEKEAMTYRHPPEIIFGQMYAVFSKGSKWHRGICRQLSWGIEEASDSRDQLYYFYLVDQGSEETVPSSLVRLLPKELEEIPKLAIHCTLNQNFKRSPYNKEDTNRFKKATQRSPMSMKIFSQEGGILNVDLAQLPSFEESDYYVSVRDALFLSHVNPRALETPPIRKFKPKYDLMNPSRPKVHLLRVYVTWAHTPSNVYVNILDEEWPRFVQLHQAMQDEFSDTTGNSHENVCKAQLCAVKQCGIWHRALVEDVVSQWQILVFLVDSGHRLTISKNECHYLPDRFTELPAQSVRCVLNGLKPVSSEITHRRTRWSPAALGHCHGINTKRAVLSVDKLCGLEVGKVDRSKELTAFSILHIDEEIMSLNQKLCTLKLATTDARSVLLDVDQARKELAVFDAIFEKYPLDDDADSLSLQSEETEEDISGGALETDGSSTKSTDDISLQNSPDSFIQADEVLACIAIQDSNLSSGHNGSNLLTESREKLTQITGELKESINVQENLTLHSCKPEPSADIPPVLLMAPQEISSSSDEPENSRSQSQDSKLCLEVTPVSTSNPADTRAEVSFGMEVSLKTAVVPVSSSEGFGRINTRKSKCHCEENESKLEISGGRKLVLLPAGMPRSRRTCTDNCKQKQPRSQRKATPVKALTAEKMENAVMLPLPVSRAIDGALLKFSWCLSPNEIYFRTEEMSITLQVLMSKMEKHYEHSKPDSAFNFENGCLCAVFYEDQWQRARIIEYKQSDHTARIILWDRGFEREVNSSCIRPIDPEFEEIPKLILCVSLHGIFPREEAWDDGVKLFITERLSVAETIKFYSKCEENSSDERLSGVLRCTYPAKNDSALPRGSVEIDFSDELIDSEYASPQLFVRRPKYTRTQTHWARAAYPLIGDRFWIKVSGVSKTGHFFFRDVRAEGKIVEISRLLAQKFDGTSATQGDLNAKPGDICVAKFIAEDDTDEKWYRCIVWNSFFPEEGGAYVKAVDLGWTTKVNRSNIRLSIASHCADLLDVPMQSLSCKLHHAKLLGGRQWDGRAKKKVCELALLKEFECRIMEREPELYVVLERGNSLLAKELADQDLVEFVDSSSKIKKQF